MIALAQPNAIMLGLEVRNRPQDSLVEFYTDTRINQ